MTTPAKATANPPMDFNAARCPLCSRPNHCQLCTMSAYKGPCWCAAVQIPDGLLERVPTAARNRACICRECVDEFHLGRTGGLAQSLRPEDFYFDRNGLMVFTADYHLRRGYCCGSNCRHCPFPRAST